MSDATKPIISLAASQRKIADQQATIDALKKQVEALEAVMQPFNIMAGELFARNYNNPITVCRIGEFGQSVELIAADFFAIRAALGETE